jgi:glycosyltransferase involved in cell wall biosynthesis
VRIAFLADSRLPHTKRWVDFFVRRGHECIVLTLEPAGGFSCPVVALPARRSWPRFLAYTSSTGRAARVLRDFRPQLVNAHFLPNYGWMAARLGLRPLVLTALGSDILLVPRRTPLHRWRTRWVLGRCDRVTADAAMLARAIERFGVPAERILMVPFGIERGRFAAAAARPASPVVVLSTRRFEPVYDVATLLRAAGRLPAALRAGLQVRLAGTGAQENALRRLALAPPAQFLGWLDRSALDAELLRAHVYVSTARSDSTSVSLLEAMAAGCFPVVTDIAGNREWIRDGDNGLLFAGGHDEALERCLARACTDAALRDRAAHRNRDIVAARADWDAGMASVERLFASLVEARG